jgi:CBS domain-containing protein
MARKTVFDWMHREVIGCHRDTSVEEVALRMQSRDVSALVVVDEVGEAVGVISRTDLVNARFAQPYFKHWRGMTAAHLMTRSVVSVTSDTPINKAAALLKEKKVHRLVVVDREGGKMRPVGILSVTDLTKGLET